MKKLTLIASALTMALTSTVATAKLSQADVDKLGKSLTPVGGEMAGNADGSIPAWTNGITTPPAGYKPGDHHPDPYGNDKVLFTITKANLDQYKANLSPGQIKMFDTYPDTFSMKVYPTRRSASYPQHVYDATKKYAATAELVEGGNGVKGVAIGVPFPIPANGLEAIWNHTLRYRGVNAKRWGGQAAPTANGSYTMIGFDDKMLLKYSEPQATPEVLSKENILFKFKQKVTVPARLAGTALLVHETMDQIKTPRQAWTYNTGQRRVRRAPNVAYDAPGTASDGLRTTDDFDMFNGSPNRYNWELKGKKELYIPYNSYKLHSDSLKYADILQAGHINPEYVRYEKHRVWVVEATLKDGLRHTYGKRTFYMDEDSWQIHIADTYDNRNELFRLAVAYGLNYYEVPTPWSTLDVYHDFNSRRYLAIGLDNEEAMYDFSQKFSDRDFTPAALRREGRR
jgi:hypothetical protein